MRIHWLSIMLIGCTGTPHHANAPTTIANATAPSSTDRSTAGPEPPASTTTTAAPPRVEDLPPATCDGAVMRFNGGREVGWVCPDEIAESGLTVVDLGDEWTPSLFAPGPDGQAPEFRAQYLELAAETDGDGKRLEGLDSLDEMFGIVPSPAVARSRLDDDARHECIAKVDSAAIAQIEQSYGEEDKEAIQDANENVHRGMIAMQQRLVCEGFLSQANVDGFMSWRTANAIDQFQRRNFLMPNRHLDAETKEALQQDSRELDFRLALRILRERIADTSGLIEDGTADAGPRPILGRMLDPEAMRGARGNEGPLPNGAEDLISPATETAARQLGWTSPAGVRNFLAHYRHGTRVALKLPAPPTYHSAQMDLYAELDRGDIWYDDTPTEHHAEHRPTLILYVRDQGTVRPLIRWPTTIGGWADVQAGDRVVRRWKESGVGPRVWRQLYAAPTWIPPATTPAKDLVKDDGDGQWSLKGNLGPGPHGAFGLMLLEHEKQRIVDGVERYEDPGIGTHGSGNVVSIVDGTSHGCHRLYNQYAVRLGDFLLRHREHVVKGDQPASYSRTINLHGTFHAHADTRGFLYELTPPISINVLEGNVLSERKVPPSQSAPAQAD